MLDDEVDLELFEFFCQYLQGKFYIEEEVDIGVFESVEFVYDNGIDVVIDMCVIKFIVDIIYWQMKEKSYFIVIWLEYVLYLKVKDECMVDFIFIMDLLNFSFWFKLLEDERFVVEYKGK